MSLKESTKSLLLQDSDAEFVHSFVKTFALKRLLNKLI